MGSTLELIKNVWDLVEKSKDAALKQAFVDLRMKIIGVQEENVSLREQVMELQKRLQREEAKLEWDGQFYWDRTAPDGPAQGPLCQRCHDSERKSVRLHPENYGYRCKVCNAFYQTQPYPEPPSFSPSDF